MINITASEARKRLYALLDSVADSHEPIRIAGKRHAAVLVAEEDWRAIEDCGASSCAVNGGVKPPHSITPLQTQDQPAFLPLLTSNRALP